MREPMQISFKPGEIVTDSGVYLVEHHRHRLSHRVTILEGSLFPACRQCGEKVSFHLERRVSENNAVFGSFCEVLEEYSFWKNDGSPPVAA